MSKTPFLLQNKGWPGTDYDQLDTRPGSGLPTSGQPVPRMPPPPYVAETSDYGVIIGAIKNDKLESGEQRIYFVIHKQHEVIATEAYTLAYAIQVMSAAQSSLDEAMGKEHRAAGAN